MSETTVKRKKKKSALGAYFTSSPLRVVCDMLMIVGALLIFIGLFTHSFLGINGVILTGLIMYVLASLIAFYRCIKVLRNKELSKKSAEKKNATINIVVMAFILALAVVGILAIALGW